LCVRERHRSRGEQRHTAAVKKSFGQWLHINYSMEWKTRSTLDPAQAHNDASLPGIAGRFGVTTPLLKH
jgi:hypothetical protein